MERWKNEETPFVWDRCLGGDEETTRENPALLSICFQNSGSLGGPGALAAAAAVHVMFT